MTQPLPIFALTISDAQAWAVLITTVLTGLATFAVTLITVIRQATVRAEVKEVAEKSAADRVKIAESIRLNAEKETSERLAVATEVRAAAAKVKADLDAAALLVLNAHSDLKTDLAVNTEISREAFKEANGVNVKFAAVHEGTLASARAIAQDVMANRSNVGPLQVEVINLPSDPVPVAEIKPAKKPA